MGDYDVVKDVLAKQGEIFFWKVRAKPAKPLAFGAIRRTGDGNTNGICLILVWPQCRQQHDQLELFVRPAILKMMGKRNLSKPIIEVL
jgi:molybdopterin molybdotransferase